MKIFLVLLTALVMLVSSNNVVYSIDKASLVGAWLFDGKGDNVFMDSSGNHFDGKIGKGNPKPVAGIFGGALEFSGVDEVTIPDNDALALEEFTLAVWVNIPKITGSYQTIVTKDAMPATRNYGLFCNPSGAIHYAFGSDVNGVWGRSDGKTSVADGKWHHVAATYKNPDFNLYVDGVLDGNISPGLKPPRSNGFLYIGGYDLQNFWAVGTIDEASLFNKALSKEEIGELMKGLSLFVAVQPMAKLPFTWGNIKDSK